MKILKDVGTFEVLSKPEDVIHSIAMAARTCYQSQDKSSPENDIKLVKNLMTRGHFAMYEFADITVKFNNVSRGFTHELVRHRIASYAQESTRYVDEKDFEFVVPPHRYEKEPIDIESIAKLPYIHGNTPNSTFGFSDCLETIGKMYRKFRELGWKPEDARQLLPTALNAEIVMKASIREWRHVFTMRCDMFAHWEIRSVMLKLLKWCQSNIPVVFDDFNFFKTKDGIEYARPVLSSFNLSEKITEYVEHFEFVDVVRKLDEATKNKLLSALNYVEQLKED